MPISGQMVLGRSPWPVFLINFPLNPSWECNQFRDAGGHPEYTICSLQTADGYLKKIWVKKGKRNRSLLILIF